jgi:hypothetical protein
MSRTSWNTRQDQTPRGGEDGVACGIHRPDAFLPECTFGPGEKYTPGPPTTVNEFGAQADNRNMGL